MRTPCRPSRTRSCVSPLKRVAAFFFEPVIGAGGVLHPAEGYIGRRRRPRASHGILLVSELGDLWLRPARTRVGRRVLRRDAGHDRVRQGRDLRLPAARRRGRLGRISRIPCGTVTSTASRTGQPTWASDLLRRGADEHRTPRRRRGCSRQAGGLRAARRGAGGRSRIRPSRLRAGLGFVAAVQLRDEILARATPRGGCKLAEAVRRHALAPARARDRPLAPRSLRRTSTWAMGAAIRAALDEAATPLLEGSERWQACACTSIAGVTSWKYPVDPNDEGHNPYFFYVLEHPEGRLLFDDGTDPGAADRSGEAPGSVPRPPTSRCSSNPSTTSSASSPATSTSSFNHICTCRRARLADACPILVQREELAGDLPSPGGQFLPARRLRDGPGVAAVGRRPRRSATDA